MIVAAAAFVEDMSQVATQEIEELDEERRGRKKAEMRVAELEKRVQCVMCLVDERGVMFQPCFHLVSCTSCQHKVGRCPVQENSRRPACSTTDTINCRSEVAPQAWYL